MNFIDGIFYVAVLIMSVVAHEFAHAYAAYKMGDDTAHLSGRLTLNPFKHLDIFGSILLPLFLVISKAGFVIGWAKPVPYNPNNIRDPKKGTIIISAVGIFTNLAIAVVFGLLVRLYMSMGMPVYAIDGFNLSPILKISTIIVLVNIVLAIFNLIPIPPLDGSKLLFSLIPYKYRFVQNFLEQWGMFVLLFFIIFLWEKVSPVIYFIFSLLTGIN
jgi:Zn-dependent protease